MVISHGFEVQREDALKSITYVVASYKSIPSSYITGLEELAIVQSNLTVSPTTVYTGLVGTGTSSSLRLHAN